MPHHATFALQEAVHKDGPRIGSIRRCELTWATDLIRVEWHIEIGELANVRRDLSRKGKVLCKC